MVQGLVRRGLILALLAVAVAGCSAPGRRGPDDSGGGGALPAVRALETSAQVAMAEGDFEQAAADLERALRLQPRDADLWYELAEVRRAQGQYAEAESLALRSNSLSGGDAATEHRNWTLIATCRRARGDEAGAREAEANAGG